MPSQSKKQERFMQAAAQAAVEKIAQAYQRFLRAEQAAGRRRVMTIGG